VPLERNTVRYLDNFSGGGRGSASAEYFIEHGYAVLFLYRRHSLQPYGRHFLLHKQNNFLDYLVYNERTSNVEVCSEYARKTAEVIKKYEKAKEENFLLKVVFQTIHEYLFLLKAASQSLQRNFNKALIYSSAAVSDFYLPYSKMAEHKIQSSSGGGGGLDLHLEPVPKMLGPLCSDWAPQAFVVSFKLETDQSLLASKVFASLHRYGHQLVIGNMLQSYKDTITIFPKGSDKDASLIKTVSRSKEEIERDDDIENGLIEHVVKLHDAFIAANAGKEK